MNLDLRKKSGIGTPPEFNLLVHGPRSTYPEELSKSVHNLWRYFVRARND